MTERSLPAAAPGPEPPARTASTAAPPKDAAPAQPQTNPTRGRKARAAPAKAAASGGPVQFASTPAKNGQRIVIYGPGGIGKSSLAASAPGPVAMFDLDESLSTLYSQFPEPVQDQLRIVSPPDAAWEWQALRNSLHAPGWDDVKFIEVDSVTNAEELATRWVIKNVPHEKGNRIERIEDYGFGKGYTHIYETFLNLLGDLDVHARAGRNIVLIAHDCTANVPNPQGEDFIRYEPRLQAPASGKNSIRLRLREWADHVLFVGYDIDVKKDGKATGSGTRTIYPVELPHCMAKSRTLSESMAFAKFDAGLWDLLDA